MITLLNDPDKNDICMVIEDMILDGQAARANQFLAEFGLKRYHYYPKEVGIITDNPNFIKADFYFERKSLKVKHRRKKKKKKKSPYLLGWIIDSFSGKFCLVGIDDRNYYYRGIYLIFSDGSIIYDKRFVFITGRRIRKCDILKVFSSRPSRIII